MRITSGASAFRLTGSRVAAAALLVVAAAVVTTLWVTVSLELTGSVTSVAALARPIRAPGYQDAVRADEVDPVACRNREPAHTNARDRVCDPGRSCCS
jgi:hypothetical protein